MTKLGSMLGEVMRHICKKPATLNYPAEPAVMPENFRGKLTFYATKCIGCKMCSRDCPSGAIVINKIGDKQFECLIDLGLCVYCGQCVESCPKDALEMTRDFELAQLSREKLKITFEAAPPPPAPAAPAGNVVPKAS